jgi:4-amino-4-deoxy-L-arabinose transferase-like glycosyltransferase
MAIPRGNFLKSKYRNYNQKKGFLTLFGMTFGLGKLAKMLCIFAILFNEMVIPSGVRNPFSVQ